MTAEQLLLAIGEIKEETVLAADRPRKRPVPHLWVAVTAVAAAVVIGVLGYVGFLKSQQQKPPVSDPIPAVSTVPVTTTTTVWGTGGDYDACKVHSFEYHNIDGYLLDLVTQEEMNVFIEKHQDEDMTIVAFVEYFGIAREQFIAAMKWGDKLDQVAEHDFPNGPYTYGQFVDAIYEDDEEITAWVFVKE